MLTLKTNNDLELSRKSCGSYYLLSPPWDLDSPSVKYLPHTAPGSPGTAPASALPSLCHIPLCSVVFQLFVSSHIINQSVFPGSSFVPGLSMLAVKPSSYLINQSEEVFFPGSFTFSWAARLRWVCSWHSPSKRKKSSIALARHLKNLSCSRIYWLSFGFWE